MFGLLFGGIDFAQTMKSIARPDFEAIKSGEEFNSWYWLKEELVTFCKYLRLPHTGGKFALRDRIIYALDHNGQLLPQKSSPKKKSKFNWANASLTLDTVITDNVSFGPNFRNFMQSQIGNKFSCHSDFMDWVKSNTGKTLQEAVLQWQALEDRKKDGEFRREIADHNMLAQYVRDFLEDNPGKTLKDALQCWKVKRRQPTQNGFVVYAAKDLDFDGIGS